MDATGPFKLHSLATPVIEDEAPGPATIFDIPTKDLAGTVTKYVTDFIKDVDGPIPKDAVRKAYVEKRFHDLPEPFALKCTVIFSYGYGHLRHGTTSCRVFT